MEKLEIREEHGVNLAENSEGSFNLLCDDEMESMVDDSDYELTSSDRHLMISIDWRALWLGHFAHGVPGFVDQHKDLFQKHFGLDILTSFVRLETSSDGDWPYGGDYKAHEAVGVYLTAPCTKSRLEKGRPSASVRKIRAKAGVESHSVVR